MIEEVRLEDLLTLQRGFDISKKEQNEGTVPVVSSGGISSYHDEYKVKGPGVTVGRKGTLGTVFYIEENFWAHSTCLWVKDFKGNDPKFIYYFIKTLHFEKFDSGAANPTLNRNHVHKLKLKVPLKKYRSKIADILYSYDELIKNNNERISLLEEMAEEIYKEWFVRMRFPNYQNTPFFDKNGIKVSNKINGALPKEWRLERVGSFYSVKSGYAFKSAELGDIGVPIIKIRNIDNLTIDIKRCDRFSGNINARVNKFELSKGDLLVAMTGATIGKIALFPIVNEKYYLNQRVGKFFPKNDFVINQAYIYQFCKSKIFKETIINYALGAAQPNISGEQIENIGLLIPSEKVLTKFSNMIGLMMEEVFTLKAKNEVLQQTRDLLLPRLISGKLNVEHLATI